MEVPYNRVVVMGISQAGDVALKLALQPKPPWTALVALSTTLEPLQAQVTPPSLGSPALLVFSHRVCHVDMQRSVVAHPCCAGSESRQED